MSKARILIVEDEIVVANDLKMSLEGLGYTVTSIVASAKEAIKRAEEEMPDIVIMDIMLAGEMDGIEAAEQIHSRFNIPVIYLTAYADEGILERTKMTEPFGYLLKPFEDRELHIAVKMGLYKHKMERILRESELWFSTTLRSIGDAVITTDINGRVTFMNPVAEVLTGWKQENALGKPLEEVFNLVNEETGKGVKSHVEMVIQGHIIEVVGCTLVVKDGRKISIDDSVAPLKNDEENIIGTVLVFRDVTERKHAEEKLQQERDRAQQYLDIVGVIIVAIDARGVVMLINNIGCEVLGYKQEEIVGKNWFDNFLPQRVRQEVKVISQKLLAGEIEPGEYYENPILTRSGEERIITWHNTVLKDDKGNIIGHLSSGDDVTKRKQAEERGKQLQQELIIASRLATVGEMSAGIAHEINNPLTGVIGFAGLLLKKDIPDEIRKNVNTIYEGAQRIASVTSRMLTFARQQKPERTLTNINDIIGSTLAMRSYEMKSSNIKVTTELDPDLPVIVADAGQIQQVFLNIVLNAEIEMKKAHQCGNLTVKTERIDNTIWISFKDDGQGIPKKNMERIFEPFFTTREVGKGSGLGLSVSYGIVIQHGGKIYARSRLGKGATFVVELPIITRAEQLKLAEPAAEVKKVAGVKILVVDDELAVQDFLNEVLSKEGHEVEIVGNGEDALERLDSEDYDLILLDIKLPGMSGTELYGHIQRTARPLASRVIFITGDVMSDDTMTYLLSAGPPYITKPFDAEQLLKGIARILSQKS